MLEEPKSPVHSGLRNSVPNAAAEANSAYSGNTEEDRGTFCLPGDGESEVVPRQRSIAVLKNQRIMSVLIRLFWLQVKKQKKKKTWTG